MQNLAQNLRRELPAMLKLAVPLIVAELGWMCMGLVDTMMVGRMKHSAQAMGAVSLGDILFFTVTFFGAGLLLGVDALVSQQFGAGRLRDCHRILWNAVFLGVPISAAIMGVVALWPRVLLMTHANPQILPLVRQYLAAISWSALPLLLFQAFRRYLQGMNHVKPIAFAMLSANLVNLTFNWLLIYGHWGFPAMGVAGSGWSTCLARTYMWLVLLCYTVYRERGAFAAIAWPDLRIVGELLSIGWPAATQYLAEIGVFATATALIARLDAASLAANQVAMNVISLAFMVPLGISGAAAVRVGQAMGRGDRPAAARSGWTAVGLGGTFMAGVGLTLLLFPQYIVRAYTPDPGVRAIGVQMLIASAFFELFDGLQITVTGALRGLGDTRTPMLCHLLSYWAFGLPLGYWLCFYTEWGAVGMWMGLSLAVILIGLILILYWRRHVLH